MSQQVAISSVLRAVPNHLLKRWFDDHVPGQLPFSIESLEEGEIEPMLAFHDELPPEKRDEMDIDLQNVHSFANPAGMSAFCDGAQLHHVDDLMQRIPEDLDLYGRAMWVRLYEPEIFKSSAMFLQLERCQFWRRRNDVPEDLAIASDAKERLSEAISNLLRRDGRGRFTSVDIIKRNDVLYFIAHPDDYVRSENTHDASGRLTPMTIRPTTQIIFAYHPREGSLQLATSIKQPRKGQLEQEFSRVVLGWELGAFQREVPYQLGHLKNSTFTLITDPMDRIRARIESIGLFNKATNRPITIGVDRKNEQDTIYQAIEEEIGKQSDSLWHFKTTFVEIKFHFPTSRFRRASSPTIRVTPTSCNLARLTSDRAEIVQKHLKMWGVDNASGDQSALAAMGG